MRALFVTLTISALSLTGCGTSAPTCDNAQAISRLKSKLTAQLQEYQDLVPASAAVGEEQTPERIEALQTCTSSVQKRLKAALKSELGVENDEVPDFLSLKYRNGNESDFCSLRYEQFRTSEFNGIPLPKGAYKPSDKEATCYGLFTEANNSYEQCSTAKFEEFDRKRIAAIAKIQFFIDEIRFKGRKSQGLVLMCVATIRTANPNSGETTGEATYTVEQTTDGKPYVTLEKAWGLAPSKP